MRLTFIETPLFTATAKGVLSDREMRALEDALLENPQAGPVENGTGGARKIRVALPGRGKSGGARVMYVYVERSARVYFLIAYPKNVLGSLNETQKKALRTIIRAIQQEG